MEEWERRLRDDEMLTQTQHMPSQAVRLLAVSSMDENTVAQLISLIDRNERYALRKEQREVRIGRSSDCDVVVADKRVSNCHLRIYRDDAFRYFVEEMSANGSFVNEQRMRKGDTRALLNGDEISVCVPGPSHAGPSHICEYPPFAAYLFRLVGSDSWSDLSPLRAEHGSDAGPVVAVGGDADCAAGCVSEQWVRSHWDLRVKIGSGNFSEVRLGVHVTNGEKRAVKVVDKQKFFAFQNRRDSQLSLVSEATLLTELSHPGIVRCFEWFQTDANLYLVMEFVEGGDLLQCIIQRGCLTEAQARHVFGDLSHAIAHLHGRDIVHRDLKPDNILLTSRDRDTMRPKIADFGLARKNMHSRGCQTFCGTPHYFAPEVISTSRDREAGGEDSGYGKAADMWSLGVVLYIMLSGTPPFEDDGLYEQILEGRYDFDVDEWTIISPEAKEIVQGLMTVDPKGRLAIEGVLRQQWLAQHAGDGVAGRPATDSGRHLHEASQTRCSPSAKRRRSQ
mmetsp:Transcript_79531/g.221284  ORF Transcript_79531/g.221284 Transcript_79531/m.221284 type:complete len:506 (-) Transcript_79531:45-1562(-)